jgi:3'-phosphoadenosine 5'-phosphosulfate (PAPS) 3'-phosphatase
MNDPLTEAVYTVMHDAARRITPRYQHLAEGEIIEKAHDDLVTIADKESEAILSEGLAKILPEAAIVGEESALPIPPSLAAWAATCAGSSTPRRHQQLCPRSPAFRHPDRSGTGRETIGGWIYDVLTGASVTHAGAKAPISTATA